MTSQVARSEKAAAVRAAGGAAVGATCPWGNSVAEPPSSALPAPAVRSTCPWLPGEPQESARSQRSTRRESHNTCPWGSVANDAHSEQLAAAQRRREKATPSFMGAAGSGAPKMSDPLNKHFDEHALAHQAEPPAPTKASIPGGMNGAPQVLNEQDFESVQVEDDEDERNQIIQQCLSEGLEEDQIMEILDQWHCSKMVEKVRAKQNAQQPASELERTGMAQGTKKCVTINPNDSEISGCAKENMTPFDAFPNSNDEFLSLAAKRSKAKQASEASIGSFGSDGARSEYFKNKSAVEAARAKARGGAGIF